MSKEREREDFVYMAKIAEKARFYEDMVEWLDKIYVLGVRLTAEEQSLLMVAIKNSIAAKREKCRIMYSMEEEEVKGNARYMKNIKDYQEMVVAGLENFCKKTITLIAEHLLPADRTNQSRVLYGQLTGDCYCCLAKWKSVKERQETLEQALKAYEDATAVAEAELVAIHLYRLSAVLNLSVFYAKSLGSPRRALESALSALESAGRAMDQLDPYLDSLSEESQRARTLIIGQLKENIGLWSSDASDAGPSC